MARSKRQLKTKRAEPTNPAKPKRVQQPSPGQLRGKLSLHAGDMKRVPFAVDDKTAAWVEAYRRMREEDEPGLRVTQQGALLILVRAGLAKLAEDLEP